MINVAEQDLQYVIVEQIETLNRNLRQLKSTLQPIGSDILKTDTTAATIVGPYNLLAGQVLHLYQRFNASQGSLSMVEPHFTFYVDALDSTHRWPNNFAGTGVLTGAQQNMDPGWRMDWGETDPARTQYTFAYWLRNNDNASHNIWLAIAYIYSQQGTSIT